MVNSKQKGSSFERKISKELSLWLSSGKRDDLFWRTHSSGGRFTQRKKSGKNTSGQDGDITSTDKASELFSSLFSIECKHVKNLDLWSMITRINKKDCIWKFWLQTKKQAEEAGKIPVLIALQNYKPTLLVSNNVFMFLINSIFDIHPDILIKNDIEKLEDEFNELIVFFIYEKFLKLNPQQFIKRLSDVMDKYREGNNE